jgi:SAM-dependent methyltransferase
MFLEESKWIIKQREKLEKVESVLDIGSSDLEYRECKQAYISEMYAKFSENIDTLDLKNGSGVDFVLDITDKDCARYLGKYDLVLVCNILEHIEISKLGNVVKNVSEILKDGGYCIVTVPFNIEYHPSPIDNGFRPTAEELEKVFSFGFEKIICEKIVCSHYREPYISNPSLLPLPEVTCGVFKKRAS